MRGEGDNMNIRDMKEGKYARLTEDIHIGAIKLEKDTVFIIEEIDKSHFTVRNQFVGWGILENENAIHFVESDEIEYKEDLAGRFKKFI